MARLAASLHSLDVSIRLFDNRKEEYFLSAARE